MKGSARFPHLLASGRIGTLAVANRMVMSPMEVGYGSTDSHVTQRIVDYYTARAAGGIGLIIIEGTCVELKQGNGDPVGLGIDDDKFLPGLNGLAEAIKRLGVPAMIQLMHAGREAKVQGVQPVAPSALPSIARGRTPPRALEAADIVEIVERFVSAAERARRAGFDGVELHGGHGYLLAQFLTPVCNQRTDEYGGSLENRARMLLQVVRGIRHRLGADFPLSVRLSADEFVPDGVTLEDSCRVARWLEEAGVDLLNISAGGNTSPKPVTIAPAFYPRGHLLYLAAAVKQCVTVPIIGVGRINTPELAEEALSEGKCDFVALARAVIADPQFARKVASGRPEEIVPCTACVYCLQVKAYEDKPVECADNPAVGREREARIKPAARRKRVMVIGGGVAGMEAARVAALRGHDVTLCEESDRLGGQLLAAKVPPHKDLGLLLDYYVTQMSRVGVTTRLGERIDLASLDAAKPDAVIVATGKLPAIPAVPGVDAASVVVAEDVLVGRAAAGARVVVIGGGMVGCETAEHLAETGRRVTIVEMLGKMATDMFIVLRSPLVKRLSAAGVEMLVNTRAVEITPEGLIVALEDGERRLLPADTIVLAAGARPNNKLVEGIAARVREHYVVGDAVQPRRLAEAIREGFEAGLAV